MAPTPTPETPNHSGAATLRAIDQLDVTEVQVDDKVYDAKQLADFHPGGDLFVKVFAGRDATEAFLSYHRRHFPHEKMTSMLIGKTAQFKDPKADDDYLELVERIEKVLPRHKSFAPFHYYVKVLGLIVSAVGLEYFQHSTGTYRWYLSAVQGLLFAWIGMNIQHDANHGAISRSAWVNRVLGTTQNYIGGSALDWIHQHVVQHHIFPNDIQNDPDIVGNDILRLNPLKPMNSIQGYQHLYVFVLFAFFGLSYIISTFQHLVNGFHYTKMSTLVKTNRVFEEATVILFFVRWFGIPLYHSFSLTTLLNVAPVFIVGGYYLAFFFIISHNFEGAALNDQQYTLTQDKSFLRRQVLTAANVGGPILGFINGGLNYQIEHHLFPRIQHSHYPLIAPVVKQFCEERGITYKHFPTLTENVMSCVRHLYQMGHKLHPEGYREAPKKSQ